MTKKRIVLKKWVEDLLLLIMVIAFALAVSVVEDNDILSTLLVEIGCLSVISLNGWILYKWGRIFDEEDL